ncbi:MAG: hypothetical protein L0170_17225, partial [Acidobacteria bacterium]|nr:hypothetical protein [Acidobacteriota bacterium]
MRRGMVHLGRTWRWAVIAMLGLVAMALVAWDLLKVYGRHRLREARAAFEREVGTLDLGAYELPAVSEEKNAATWLTAGAEALIFFGEDDKSGGEKKLIADLAAKPASKWSKDDDTRMEAIVARNAGGFLILDHARSCITSNFYIDYPHVASTKLPRLFDFIYAAKLLRAKARLEFRRGRLEESARTAEMLGSLAASMEREPVLIVLMVGGTVERLQLSAVQDLVQSSSENRDLLTRLGSSLLTTNLTAQYRRSLVVDSAWMMGEIYEEGNQAKPRLPSFPWAMRQMPDLAAAQLLDLQRESASIVEDPYPVTRKATPPSVSRGSFLTGSWDEGVLENRLNAAARISSVLSNRRLAALAIGLRLGAEEACRYPSDLSASAEAQEPDSFTGKPLHYRVRADGSAELTSPGAAEMLAEIIPRSSGLTHS